jgi:hypothetical protein
VEYNRMLRACGLDWIGLNRYILLFIEGFWWRWCHFGQLNKYQLLSVTFPSKDSDFLMWN